MGTRTRFLLFLLSLIGLSAVSTPVFAHETSDTDSKITFSMNGGFMGVLAQGVWVSQYVYVGPSAYISLKENLAFIPNLILEVSPGSGNWGLVGTGTLEYILPKGPVALDLVPSIGQDTTSNGTTVVFWAVGPGATLALLNGMTISATLQVSGVFDQPETGVVLMPILNLGIPIR